MSFVEYDKLLSNSLLSQGLGSGLRNEDLLKLTRLKRPIRWTFVLVVTWLCYGAEKVGILRLSFYVSGYNYLVITLAQSC